MKDSKIKYDKNDVFCTPLSLSDILQSNLEAVKKVTK